MADTNKISFYHLTGALSTATLESGAIYFSDADHTIGVYDGTSMQKYYGGNVKDAVYAGKKLTIKYYDGTDAVLDFNDVASAAGVTSLLGDLRKDLNSLITRTDEHLRNQNIHVTPTDRTNWDGKQGALSTDQLAATNSGITADKVSGYDTHVGNNDIHVTAEDKAKWTGKQDALSEAQLNAANSGITTAKVSGYDTHVANTDIHVTAEQKTAWDGKQAALTDTQLKAANSGITSDKVKGYDLHINDEYIHVTTEDKAKWNAAEQNANNYTDTKIGELGTAARKDVLTGAIADSTTNEDDLVTAAQVKAYASGVVGAMHFRGAVTSTDEIAGPASGDICLVGTKEYVYNGAAWVLFGDEGAYDTKGSAATAEQNAKTYADGLNSAMDARVDVLEAIDHNAYVAADAATLASAKSYADSLADNYAAASHTHAIADVTGLQDALNGKAASSHAHAIADVTGLQDALDGKAASGHNHDTVYSKLDHNHDDAYDAKGAAATVKTEVIGNANTDTKDSNTIVGAKKYTDDAIAAATLVWKQF